MKIVVHKKFHPWYYLFFLQGLEQLSIPYSFSRLIKPEMEERLAREGFGKDYLILSVTKNHRERIIVIGADDKTDVSPELANIADTYAKTNVSAETANRDRIIPIGPTFGLRYFNNDVLKIAAADILRGDYDKWMLVAKRAPFATYLKLRNDQGALNKIFYLNYPWKKHRELTEFRLLIIKALQQLQKEHLIEFEGGFSKRLVGYHDGLRDVSATRLYNHKQYLSALASTKVVLNTSAVHNCLGWKMGEFLCLGKCMLSFPIPNVMPYSFEEGVHYHKIDDLSELEPTLRYLTTNRKYVEAIQKNAVDYFDAYVRPKKIMQRLIDHR